MQFTTALIALFAATATAIPSNVIRATSQADIDGAKSVMQKVQAGCSPGRCVAALAPSVVSCAAAAAEEGLNPIVDAACFAAAANSIANPPSSCDGCL